MGRTKTKKRKPMDPNGLVIAPRSPEWIENRALQDVVDEEFIELLVFYVINTPCKDSSARGIECTKYGWDEKMWLQTFPRQYLYGIANLSKKTFGVAKRIDEMKEACKKTDLEDNFFAKTEIERIAFYKDGNEFLSICSHIRNAFAHGRFAILKNGEDEIFIMEDGISKRGNFQVRARMILKKSTLLSWMQTLQAGKCPENIEKKSKNNKKS